MLRFLCRRCGAVVDEPARVAGEEVHSTCPECGSGFSVSSVTSAAPGSTPAATEPSPEEHERRRDADRRQALAAWAGTLYGLDASWTGRRRIGGWGEGDGLLEHIELAHGDEVRDPDTPLVLVGTHRDDAETTTTWVVQALAWMLFHETGEHTPRQREPFLRRDPSSWWDPTDLSVDGVPAPFRLLRSGAHWVAIGAVSGHVVGVNARHLEPAAVRLVAITDVEPYLADDGGSR